MKFGQQFLFMQKAKIQSKMHDQVHHWMLHIWDSNWRPTEHNTLPLGRPLHYLDYLHTCNLYNEYISYTDRTCQDCLDAAGITLNDYKYQ